MFKKLKGIVSLGKIGCVEHDFVPIKQFVCSEDVEVWSGDFNAKWLMDSIKNRISEMPQECDFFIMGYDGSQNYLVDRIKPKVVVAFDSVDFPELLPKPIDKYDLLFKLQVNQYTRKLKQKTFVYQYPISYNKLSSPDQNVNREYDISFLGGLWPPCPDETHPRSIAVDILKREFGDKFYGGITNIGLKNYIENHDFDNYLSILNKTKVVLNVSNKRDIYNGRHCRRQTEAFMMGCPIISNRMDSEWSLEPDGDICYYFKHDFSDLIQVAHLAVESFTETISKKCNSFFIEEYYNQGKKLYDLIKTELKNK